MGKRIVILGGGYAGVLTAKKLEKKLKKRKDVEIILIDSHPFHTMLTELHEVAAARVDEENIKIDFKKIFYGRRIKFVLDTIKDTDLDAKRLIGLNGEYTYDYLVIASGSKPTFFNVAGASEHAFTLWSYEDAVKLREHILRMFRTAACESDKDLRRSLLSFVVIGAGFTGVEMMGELAEWVPELCDKFMIGRSEVRLLLCDALPRVMPVLPEKVASKAKKRLEKMGVEITLGVCASEITARAVTLGKEASTVIPSCTVIWNAGVESSDVASGIKTEKVGRGRIKVDKYLRIPEREDVYVAGDNLFFVPDGDKAPVPQMVENCEHCAPVVVNNILYSLGLRPKLEAFDPKFHGMMVSVGSRYACAYVGSHKRKISLCSFFSMICKHFINILYFVQVEGFNKCWSYAMCEIFKARNRRSIFGGYFSNSAPVFWKVPLRIWVGFIWLAQASHKFFTLLSTGDKSAIFPITFPASTAASAAQSAVDSVSAATNIAAEAAVNAVSSASQVVENAVSQSLTGLPFFDKLIDWGSNWNAVATPIPHFMKPIVDWGLLTFIKPINEPFQVCMLALLFLIACSYITGTLMPISTVLSGIVCIMIYMSGLAGREIIWLFVSAIVLFGNSGMSFGLDYYLMPWIKKRLKKWRFTRKWYFYND